MEELLSPEGAGKLLGVSTRTIQRWDKEGLIKVIRTPKQETLLLVKKRIADRVKELSVEEGFNVDFVYPNWTSKKCSLCGTRGERFFPFGSTALGVQAADIRSMLM